MMWQFAGSKSAPPKRLERMVWAHFDGGVAGREMQFWMPFEHIAREVEREFKGRLKVSHITDQDENVLWRAASQEGEG